MFGVPLDMTSDRGSQFTSALWISICDQLAVQLHRTTTYNSKANGIVERFHRTMKASLMTRLAGPNWFDELRYVLLSILHKEDLKVSSAEFAYGH